jgi:hypothetical protein
MKANRKMRVREWRHGERETAKKQERKTTNERGETEQERKKRVY